MPPIASISPTNTSAIKLGASIAMEPTKQGVPADASSSQQQPQQYPPQSTLPPDRRAVQRPQPQQQYPPPFAPPQHAVQRPQLPNLQRSPYSSMPQARGRAYIPHVGAAIPGGINASHYGAYTPRFNGPAVPCSSVARSELDVSAEEYGSVSALGDNASLDRYISDLLSAGDAGSSAFVVCLLNGGREDVRSSVFRAVMGALHLVMRSRNWCVVFLELLRAPRFYELQAIVVACTMGQVRLLDVVKSENGVTSLRNLLEAVIPYPQLRWQLINRLLDEGLFHHWKGPHLLCSIFTTSTFPHRDSSIVIRHALNNFMGVLSSTFGSKSMVECFKAARNPVLQAELQAFETIILSHIVQIANGKFSNYFLQEVIEHGCERLRVNITDLVIEYVGMDVPGRATKRRSLPCVQCTSARVLSGS